MSGDILYLLRLDVHEGAALYTAFDERFRSYDSVHVRHYSPKWQRLMRVDGPWSATWRGFFGEALSASAENADGIARAMGFQRVVFPRKWPKEVVS